MATRFVLMLVLTVAAAEAMAAPEQPAAAPGPAFELVRARILEWVAARGVSDQTILDEVGRLWVADASTPEADDLLDRAVQTFAVVDPAASQFIEACRLETASVLPPEPSLLASAGGDPFYASNLRLFYGRYLVHRQMYDEALEVLAQADPKEIVDPAGLLFYQATCQHRLLMTDEGLKTLDRLLKRTPGVPTRYSSVATLMRHDLEALEDESLDQISRKMNDVERRLTLGRAGQKVQKVEAEIVASLDELIKKIEAQQGGGGGGGAGGRSNQSDSPADDSRVKGSAAPGEVDRKSFKNAGNWGAMPEKLRSKAQQLIGRDFPPHYRQAVEQYFKKLASRPADGD